MKIYYPEFILWENGEIYSGFVVYVNNIGTIRKIMHIDKLSSKQKRGIISLSGLLIPGMVNAHCHVELSWMKGLMSEVEGIEDFFGHMRGVYNERPEEFMVLEKLNQSIYEMYELGIEVCADISNTGISFLPKEHSPIRFHTFVEVFEKEGESVDSIIHTTERLETLFSDSVNNTASISLHTLFTSSRLLMKEITDRISVHKSIQSIHFLESKEEKVFFTEGRPIKNIHEKLKVEYKSNRAANIASEILPLDQRVLFVHNTYASERDIIEIHEQFKDPWFCFCPASNEFITGDVPEIHNFMKHSDNLVLGTDSYASNREMNMFAEMQVLLNRHPSLDFGKLLKMATINGARLLGLEKQYGSISPGKKPGLIQIKNYSPDRENILFEEIRRIC